MVTILNTCTYIFSWFNLVSFRYNMLNNKKVLKSVNHWHSVIVRHLTFTSEGQCYCLIQNVLGI